MDAVESFLTWPLVTVMAYSRFTVGCLIVFPSTVIRLLLKGPRSLAKYIDIYNFLSGYPLGKYVFSGIVGFFTPYTASVSPLVTNLTANECTATISNYAWLRNPFHSIHAVALMNLGEFVSGVCMLSQIQQNSKYRGIPTKMETKYYKKARGTITAKGKASLEGVSSKQDVLVTALIYDSSGELVAECSVTWAVEFRDKPKKSE